MEQLIVTIDGPAGTGKSTISRRVAKRLGRPHLDTGAFYRAAAAIALHSDVDLEDESAVTALVASAFFDQIDGKMLVDGDDVSMEIRDPAVGQAASVVAAHPAVRSALVQHQRCWVELHGGSAVVEGRDIGSVVFPNADVKIYLDADPVVRAARRAEETGLSADEVLVELQRRDFQDSSRSASPLIVPDGAYVVDTSDLAIDEVVEVVVEFVENAST